MSSEQADMGTIAKQIRENGRYSFSNPDGTKDIITVRGHGMPIWHYRTGEREIIAPKTQQSKLYEKHGFHKNEFRNALMGEPPEITESTAYQASKPPVKERVRKALPEKFDMELVRLLENNYSKKRIIRGDFVVDHVHDMLYGDLYEKYGKMPRKEFKYQLLRISRHYGKER